MPLYFAYGSNMDLAAMRTRCPASQPLGAARLMRHRFFITADGYASVARDPRGVAWGLLWDLALADVPGLDRYEDVAGGLYRKVVKPVLTAAGPRQALVYVGRASRAGVPRPGYMEEVFAAAEAAGLPAEYRRELAAWLPGSGAEPSGGAPKVRPRFAAPADVRTSR